MYCRQLLGAQAPEGRTVARKATRFHVHYTPTSTSWLNMVERFFRDLDGADRRAGLWSCHGEAEMIAKLLENVNRFPLRFTAAAKQLNRKERLARLVRIILRAFFPKRDQERAPLLVERGQLPDLGLKIAFRLWREEEQPPHRLTALLRRRSSIISRSSSNTSSPSSNSPRSA
jgi:hypothetical protein